MVADGNCVSLPLHINQKLRLFHFLSSLCISIVFFCSFHVSSLRHAGSLAITQLTVRRPFCSNIRLKLCFVEALIYIIKVYIFSFTFLQLHPISTHSFTLCSYMRVSAYRKQIHSLKCSSLSFSAHVENKCAEDYRMESVKNQARIGTRIPRF